VTNSGLNVEIIVVDGGSTDNTVDILRRNGAHVSKWVSERDSGVSEAVNKGVELAGGDALVLFADDDELIAGGLGSMVQYLNSHPEVDALMGHAQHFNEDADGTRHSFSAKQPIGRLHYSDFLKLNEVGWPTPEMSLMRRAAFQRFGKYDLGYRYLGCLDLWLRWARAGAVLEAVPIVMGPKIFVPASSNRSHLRPLVREYYHILWRYGGIRPILRHQWGPEARLRRVIGAPILFAFDYSGFNPWFKVKRGFYEACRCLKKPNEPESS
jgi:glycosyltransferase involved in cell wall biosynthesis